MINIIIFSKDRACQCDLTLTSLFKNGENLGDNISVLYTGSDQSYFDGYNKLIKKWNGNVNFIKQSNFKDNLISLVSTTLFPFNCFFTDDDIVYRYVQDIDTALSVLDNNQVCAFSLRIGNNTIIQDYHRNVPLPQPEITHYDNIHMWKWRLALPNTNYSYPLSVDGHILKTEDISRLLNKFDYDNPNSFEGRIQQFNNELSPLMASFNQSVIVNTPINRVQDAYTNLAGVKYGVDSKTLNDLWLQDYSINLEDIDFSNIYCSHQELPFTVVKK